MMNFSLKYLVLLLCTFALISGCDDGGDGEPEVSPFVGDYVISEALLTEPLVIPIVELPVVGDEIVLPVGYPVTAAIQNALLNNVDCDSPDKSWIELREDLSMYMSCAGANELDAGTWEEISATELKLNMNAAAVPPIGFPLTVTDIVMAGSELSGNTMVPLPQNMVAAMIAPAELAPGAPIIFMMNFSLTFVKQ